MRGLAGNITALLASRRFFYVVLGWFGFSALWIVFSAVYPLPFDEDFHFGIIRFLSQHGPFLAEQPLAADSFGAIVRDPSYLYHLLMTLPHRLVSLITDNQTAQIISLRLVNVALFAWALVLFRRLLLKARLSPALTHTALAIFVLIPIVPQLAAHINYDNLLLVLAAGLCLAAARILDGLRERRLDATALGALLLLGMLMSLVKYESLPIVAAAVLFVLFMIFNTFRRVVRPLPRAAAAGWKQVRPRTKFLLAAGFVLLIGLMIQRYGVNIWTHQALKPECAAVLSESRCTSYGPWARNHLLAAAKGEVDSNPATYAWTWLQALHYRLFFAVSGPANDYRNFPPLPLPAAAAIAVCVSGLTALVLYWRRVFAGHILLAMFACIAALYLAALFVEDYSQFLETGQPVAINGRYLLPIALLLAGVFGRALSLALRVRPALKAFLATIVILLFLQGGGMFTFVLRSDVAWYWPNDFVIQLNATARDMLAPTIIENNKYY